MLSNERRATYLIYKRPRKQGRSANLHKYYFLSTAFTEKWGLFHGQLVQYGTCTPMSTIQPTQPAFRSHCGFFMVLMMAFQNCPFRVFVFGSSSRFLLPLFRSLRAMWHFLFPISTTLERKQTNKNFLICCSHHEDLRYVRVCMCVESSVVFAAVVAMNGRWPSGRMYRSCRCRTVLRIRAVERFHSCGWCEE